MLLVFARQAVVVFFAFVLFYVQQSPHTAVYYTIMCLFISVSRLCVYIRGAVYLHPTSVFPFGCMFIDIIIFASSFTIYNIRSHDKCNKMDNKLYVIVVRICIRLYVGEMNARHFFLSCTCISYSAAH